MRRSRKLKQVRRNVDDARKMSENMKGRNGKRKIEKSKRRELNVEG